MATLKSKNAVLARKRINDLLNEKEGSWRAVEKKTGISRGTLYHVYKGDRRPSNKVCEALGIPPEHVSVEPLPCGHAPLKKRCPICCPGAPTKYAAHPVMRLSKIRRILNSPYKDS